MRIQTTIHRAAAAVAAAFTAAVLIAAGAPAAGAETIPFTDPSATGAIGFCDQSGHEVTSGTIGVAPFVWLAVSSAAAPSAYPGGTGKATLYVFQPRQNVDPAQWTGKQLTAASLYTSTAHPMAAGTGADPGLVDFTSVAPPVWNGLLQLRMYFTAAREGAHNRPYPAVVIRVTGTNWSVVNPAPAACEAGKATSDEVLQLPASVVSRQAVRTTAGVAPTPTSASASGHSAGATSGSAGRSTGVGGSASGSPVASVKAKHSSGSGPIIAIVVLVVLAAGAGAYALSRRRRSTTP